MKNSISIVDDNSSL